MSKEKEVFTEADQKAQLEQARIIFKEPYYIGKYKIPPITCRHSALIGKYAVKQVQMESITTPNLIAAARKNLKLQCKAVSVALLSDSRLLGIAGRIKMLLFFPLHWRILYGKLDSSDVNELFMAMVEKQGNLFFFASMNLVMEMNSLKKKKTKEEVQLLQAEQKSDSQPHS